MGAKIQLCSGNISQNPLVESNLETKMFWYFLQISLTTRETPTGDKAYLKESLLLENMPSYRR